MHARPHDPPEGGPGASQEARLVRRFLALVKMRYAERQTPETETEAFVKGHEKNRLFCHGWELEIVWYK